MIQRNNIIKLNLGCGGAKKSGFINIDWQPLVKPDVLHDLNQFPYPFSDSTFDIIEADYVLEHLDKPFLVMRELRRILKPGGGYWFRFRILAADLRMRSTVTDLI